MDTFDLLVLIALCLLLGFGLWAWVDTLNRVVL
jgi:hypothetical protein